MNIKNIWKVIKNRYRLSTKIQMNFELCFPEYLIGKCCITINNAYEVRMKKVALSTKGVIFSDTIPLSWFTSSALIPWEKVLKIDICDTTSSVDTKLGTPLSSKPDKQTSDFDYGTLQVNDPQEMTIEIPWSKEFTDYVHKNKLFDI